MEATPQFVAETIGMLYLELRQAKIRIEQLEQAALSLAPDGVISMPAGATVDDIRAALTQMQPRD